MKEYLFHFVVSLIISVLYFVLQVDHNVELKKQKTLFILSGCIFIATFAIAYICIKQEKAVHFGENKTRTFDDDISDDYPMNPNHNPNPYLPPPPPVAPQGLPAMPMQTSSIPPPPATPTPLAPAPVPAPVPAPAPLAPATSLPTLPQV